MGKRLPYTPNGKIRQALRIVWMRSRERSEALKNTGYRCSVCGVKQSVAKGREVKLGVHHLDGIDWTGLCDLVRARLLPSPERLAPLCEKCHSACHTPKAGGSTAAAVSGQPKTAHGAL